MPRPHRPPPSSTRANGTCVPCSPTRHGPPATVAPVTSWSRFLTRGWTTRCPGRLPISDLFSHGTAVASVIGSKGTILAGVNQDVTLIAVKVFNRLNEGSVAQLLAGLVYAADQGADVINMSLGDTFDRRKDRASVAAG